jgi:MoaA/NifB/PqqE/SkfB family radical SAM enzyme
LSELNEGPELQRLLVEAVREHNVLPLTGRCNLSCLFCSHRFNPPGTEAFSFGPLAIELLGELAAYLDPQQKIIIGESATRLREGEPLTHLRFMDLLKELRTRYPRDNDSGYNQRFPA